MDAISPRLQYLLHCYIQGLATSSERQELMEFIRSPDHEGAIKEWIDQEMEFSGAGFSGADVSGREASGMDVPGMEVSGIDVTGMEVSGIGFSDAGVPAAGFQGAFGWEKESQAGEERATQILSKILASSREVAKGRAEGPAEGPAEGRRIGYRWGWRVAAAVVILAGGLGGYRFLSGQRREVVAEVRETEPLHDVAPGGNKAVLLLANGSRIVLDSARSGKLVRQGDVDIIKSDNGMLAYTGGSGGSRGIGGHGGADAADGADAVGGGTGDYGAEGAGGAARGRGAREANEVLYNTLSTPKGGQFQLVLPDGTRVWLDAASSIRYPTAFRGKERKVEITGEAYFEVANNERMPFVVSAGGTRTTVLGTQFNINAYEDEKTLRTTLIEGKVKVGSGEEEKILHPGQQAVVNNTTRALVVRDADTYQAIAWKNGQFDFDDMNLPTIMRQIGRWYDVEISYQSIDENTRFGGGISRALNLSNVLRLLDKSGVHAKLEGRKIIIYP